MSGDTCRCDVNQTFLNPSADLIKQTKFGGCLKEAFLNMHEQNLSSRHYTNCRYCRVCPPDLMLFKQYFDTVLCTTLIIS